MKKIKGTDRIRLAAQQYEGEKAYWLNLLKDEAEFGSKFPIDFINGYKQPKIEQLELQCNSLFTKQLRQVSSGSDRRLFTLLMSGMAALLNRYTDNELLHVGTSIFKQSTEGKFPNRSFFLRIKIDSHISFKDLVVLTQNQLKEASNNQHYPLEALINDLKIERNDLHEFSLFDVTVQYEKLHKKEYLDAINNNLSFFFRDEGKEEESGLSVNISYNSNLYSQQTILNLFENYERLLLRLLKFSNQPLSEVTILEAEEQKNLVHSFNNPINEGISFSNLVVTIENQVNKYPDKIAVYYEGNAISYSSLWEQSELVAKELNKRGIGQSDRVNLLMERSVEMITSILGILRSGASYVPLSLNQPTNRISNLIKDWRFGRKPIIFQPII